MSAESPAFHHLHNSVCHIVGVLVSIVAVLVDIVDHSADTAGVEEGLAGIVDLVDMIAGIAAGVPLCFDHYPVVDPPFDSRNRPRPPC